MVKIIFLILVIIGLFPIKVQCGVPGYTCAFLDRETNQVDVGYEIEPVFVYLIESQTKTEFLFYYVKHSDQRGLDQKSNTRTNFLSEYPEAKDWSYYINKELGLTFAYPPTVKEIPHKDKSTVILFCSSGDDCGTSIMVSKLDSEGETQIEDWYLKVWRSSIYKTMEEATKAKSETKLYRIKKNGQNVVVDLRMSNEGIFDAMAFFFANGRLYSLTVNVPKEKSDNAAISKSTTLRDQILSTFN